MILCKCKDGNLLQSYESRLVNGIRNRVAGQRLEREGVVAAPVINREVKVGRNIAAIKVSSIARVIRFLILDLVCSQI